MKTKTAVISAVIVGVALIFVGGVGGNWYWHQRQVQKEQAELEERKNLALNKIKAMVRAVLKDPDSAIFVEVTYNPKTDVGCGLVNAKNSFGGYTGKKLFFVGADGKVEFEQTPPTGTMTLEQVAALADGLAFNDKIMNVCHGQGDAAKP